mgnify:FL=1
MLVTNNLVKDNLNEYKNKNTKLSRNVKTGKLIKLKNGLYETDKNVSGHLLASAIYNPSYLSFEYALSYYGLIPEKVVTFTNATCGKKKKKTYTNYFGTYTYRDVPNNVFAYGVKIINENEYSFQIATPEKALCDKLYTLSTLKNLEELKVVLFKDLRIDEQEFSKLNINDVKFLSENYHSKNVCLLYSLMRRENE